MIFFIETANLGLKFQEILVKMDRAGIRNYEFSRENSDLTRDGGQ